MESCVQVKVTDVVDLCRVVDGRDPLRRHRPHSPIFSFSVRLLTLGGRCRGYNDEEASLPELQV